MAGSGEGVSEFAFVRINIEFTGDLQVDASGGPKIKKEILGKRGSQT